MADLDPVAVEAEPRRVYHRELPGAGFVAIDITSAPASLSSHRFSSGARIRVFVERRSSEERRLGHEPPVLADVETDDTLVEMGELYRLASDNAALARAIMEWQARRRTAD